MLLSSRIVSRGKLAGVCFLRVSSSANATASIRAYISVNVSSETTQCCDNFGSVRVYR